MRAGNVKWKCVVEVVDGDDDVNVEELTRFKYRFPCPPNLHLAESSTKILTLYSLTQCRVWTGAALSNSDVAPGKAIGAAGV